VNQGDLSVSRDGVQAASREPKSRADRSQSLRSSGEVP
jgi:hypothetical protein